MTASAWTKDRIERLTTLWREGRTADQVARALGDGISRSAVLGKVYRMGLSTGRATPARKVEVRPSAGKGATPKPVRPAAENLSDMALDRVQASGQASLLTIGRHQCRWPIGDPRSSDFSLCGRPSIRGAYCASHAQIAYRPRPETPGALERLACLS